jgi:hypothetical protein
MRTLSERAQTNLQLYAQLHGAGGAGDTLAAVHSAYGLAVRLFAGQWRADGRPFVCHLIGVASILAGVGADCDTVVAGLLHSAYSHGDFGRGKGRLLAGSRDAVARSIGDRAEGLLYGYVGLRWHSAAVGMWIEEPGSLDAATRRMVLIRLADTLDDALDQGLALSSRAERKDGRIAVDDLAKLALVLDRPQLAASLLEAFCADRASYAEALRGQNRSSYVLGPASWAERVIPRLARLATRSA